MHQLLVKHDAGQQESVLEALRIVETSDQKAIAKCLNTLEFWGGAGSVSDLSLNEIPWTPEFRRDVQDDNRLTLLELDLIDEMQKLGIAEARALGRKKDITWIARHYGLL
jgi:hypothetical protein